MSSLRDVLIRRSALKVKETGGCPHLKEVALDRTMWSDRFERSFGPVVRQTAE
jgi:hypothetical protein